VRLFARLPLRARLALLAATAVAVSVAMAAFVSYRLLDNELNGQIDGRLQASSQILTSDQRGQSGKTGFNGGESGQNALGSLGGPAGQSAQLVAQLATCAKTPSTGTDDYGFGGMPDVQIVTTAGATCLQVATYPGATTAVVTATYSVAATAQDKAVADGTAPAYFRDATASDGTQVRVYTAPATVEGQLVAVQSIAPVGSTDSALAALAWKLGLVAVAGIFLAVLAGLLVARSALAPVRRLTRVAEHVGRTGDLSVRLPAEGRDEVGRLGRAFNKMAAALALSRNRQQRLIADAGHELRTPLTSLRTNVDLLLRSERTGRALPAGRRELMLESVDLQLHELSGLVTDLLELSRTAEGGTRRTMKVALHEAVGRAVERARLRGPGLVFDVEVEPWYVQGDPTGLDRAVVNLLDNAVKFSPPGGVITVRLKGGEYSVTDQGSGIAPEDLPKVFERFYRSDSARSLPGSGLGLAIVAQVAKESGGTVDLGPAMVATGATGATAGSSTTGGPSSGTTARLRLPGSG
jgi:two-component system sensor histidine kinase MprB